MTNQPKLTMATLKQGISKRLNMSERAQQQLDLHYPSFPAEWLWRRKANPGFTTVPRTLPLAMQAIDAESKGQPAGHTLFCLWSRSPDHPLVIIENPVTFASEVGFFGERAVDTWRRRMKKLKELGFIVPKKGPSGDFHYVLLTNPNAAMEYMYKQGLVQRDLYARFIDRLNDIGAHRDIDIIRGYWTSINAQNAADGAPKTPTAQAQTVPTLPVTQGVAAAESADSSTSAVSSPTPTNIGV